MASLYRHIFKQALQVSWRNKFLWIFGFFGAWASISGEYELMFGSRLKIIQQGLFFNNLNYWITQAGILKTNFFSNFKYLLTTEPMTIIPMLLLSLLILGAIIFVIWAVIVSQSGLIAGIKKIGQAKNTDFSEGLNVGIKKFWPIFWLNVIVRLVVFVLFAVMAILMIVVLAKDYFANPTAGLSWYNLILFIASFIIFVPLAVILTFVTRYASCFVVIKNYRFRDSFKLGLTLFKKNWLISLETAIFLILIYFVANLLLGLALLIIAAPLGLLLALFYSFNFVWGVWLIFGLGLIILLAISILFASWLATFQYASWTLLFIQLTEKGGISKLVRLATELPGRLRKVTKLIK